MSHWGRRDSSSRQSSSRGHHSPRASDHRSHHSNTRRENSDSGTDHRLRHLSTHRRRRTADRDPSHHRRRDRSRSRSRDKRSYPSPVRDSSHKRARRSSRDTDHRSGDHRSRDHHDRSRSSRYHGSRDDSSRTGSSARFRPRPAGRESQRRARHRRSPTPERRGNVFDGPRLSMESSDETESMIYRGGSLQNIKSWQRGRSQSDTIISAKNPTRGITMEQHIAEDHPDSPFVSFETEGHHISAMKYAPKPTDRTGKPVDVEDIDAAYLKSARKSYSSRSQRGERRLGLTFGVERSRQDRDLSKWGKGDHTRLSTQKAKKMAVADREVLRDVLDGAGPVKRSDVRVTVASEQVDRAYHDRHRYNQSAVKAVTRFKPGRGRTKYFKQQIVSGKAEFSNSRYRRHTESNTRGRSRSMSPIPKMKLTRSPTTPKKKD